MAKQSLSSAQALMSIKPASSIFFCGLLILALFLTSPQSFASGAFPNSFTATYKLKLGPVELAQMTRRLYTNDLGHYVFESHSKPTGYARWLTNSELKESSEWVFHNGGLRPLNYIYSRSGDKKRHVELAFNWHKSQVTNTINDDPWKMSIPDGTLDKLLYHLVVMYELQLGKTQFEYEIADGGKLKTVRFNFVGEETLKTKLGTLTTIKMHHPGKNKANDTWLWFAKELDYLPVQIQQQKKAGKVMVTIQSLEGISIQPDMPTKTVSSDEGQGSQLTIERPLPLSPP